MMENVTVTPLGIVSFEESVNGSFPLVPEFDILFQPEPVLIALYVPTILISLLANILLIVVAVKCKYTKNVTNIFLVNLSAADILVTSVCMPLQLSKAVTLVWFYGEAVCKLVNYMQGVAVAASVFTLAAMSVDRWLSISPAQQVRPPGRKQAVLLLALLWMAALLIFIPLLMVASVQTEQVPIIALNGGHSSIVRMREVHFCTETWEGPESRKQFGIFSFSMVYAIPGTVTILSYILMGRTLCSVRPPFDMDEGNLSMQQGLRIMKERKRVAWILLLLAVLFAACWLPYNIMQLLLDINPSYTKHLSTFLPYALYLGHANSAINPIVYCLMTRNFQRSAKKILCGKGVCKQTTFTWRCNQKPEGSSSDYDLYHEPHKRCYLQMATLRHNGHTHTHKPQPGAHTRTQLSHVTRSSRRTAPAHALSADMLHRHGHIDYRY